MMMATSDGALPLGFLQRAKIAFDYVMTNFSKLGVLPVMAFVSIQLFSRMKYCPDLQNLYQFLKCNLVVFCTGGATGVGLLIYFTTRPRPVYLVNYSCYRPPDHLRVKFSKFMNRSRLTGDFGDSSLEFQRKILERSGIGEETYLPEALHRLPPSPSLMAAREEAEQVMFGVLDSLFGATGVKPNEIGILVVTCSLFNPTPSLSAMIMNKYKLQGNVRSFNLGGMGCSAGMIAVDLAKNMLQIHRNTYAIVVNTENITQNWYFGNRKSMLIPNCLFRMGGSAILLSNRSTDKQRSKYRVRGVIRTHIGSENAAFRCVNQEQDERGITGVSLSKDLMSIAGAALKTNITALGPLVLPVRERILFLVTLIARKLVNSQIKPYIPDFKLAFDHFCIHSGGRAVIDEVEKNLRLKPIDVEASRMTLHRFGNTSSSSIWYELAYIEAKGRMRKGQRAWQIAFGSGFKCNSAVWEALRDVEPAAGSPWMDCIDRYPVEIVG